MIPGRGGRAGNGHRRCGFARSGTAPYDHPGCLSFSQHVEHRSRGRPALVVLDDTRGPLPRVVAAGDALR